MTSTFYRQQNTAKNWMNTGATGVITLASLANGAGRQGDRIDLGATFAAQYTLRFRGKATSSPTAGLTLCLFLAWCVDTTYTPGELGASDAAYSDTDLFGQLVEYPIAFNNSTNSQGKPFPVVPMGRYVIPVVYNRLGVSLGATASDFEISLTPIEDIV